MYVYNGMLYVSNTCGKWLVIYKIVEHNHRHSIDKWKIERKKEKKNIDKISIIHLSVEA